LKMPFRAPEAAHDLGMVLVLHGPLPVLGPILVSPQGGQSRTAPRFLSVAV
jgi:hypothetical protein